jgi:hypothetical protein
MGEDDIPWLRVNWPSASANSPSHKCETNGSWLEQDEVLAVLFRMTVILRQKIYQRAIGFIIIWQGKVHLLRLRTEIMHTEDGVVAPCISHRQDVD